ncbi:MAG: PIG-L family deacetylase, partial [Dehalococcoidia bacterium]
MSIKAGLGLMAVVAHPDDETFGCGGLLAKYAAEGVRVSVVCATRGEAGEISDPSLASAENLAQVRERELRKACRALGVETVYILGYRDSGMGGAPSNHHPRALRNAPIEEVSGRIVEAIRRERPQVILTFDPDGGYGHPDHIAIHKAAREAFTAAALSNRYPGQLKVDLQPFQPHKLYYFVFPRSAVAEFRRALQEAGVESRLAEGEA